MEDARGVEKEGRKRVGGGEDGERKGRKLSAWKRAERVGLLSGNKRDG